MSNLNSTELTAAVADATGLKRDTAKVVLVALGDVIQKALATGGEVTLPGLGKIAAVERKARIGTNPSNGAKIEIAARRVAKLKPSAEFKHALSAA